MELPSGLQRARIELCVCEFCEWRSPTALAGNALAIGETREPPSRYCSHKATNELNNMQTSGGSAARFYPVRSRLVRTLPP